MKVIITGAHFTPAQAVIEQLIKISNNENPINLVYIGRKHTLEADKALSVESQILPTLGVKFIPIIAGRLRRSIDFATFIALLKIPIGFVQSFYFLIKERPDVVLSFGGYVGLPVVICAWLLSIPVIIHEQTLVSGISNKLSGLFADKIAVSFDTNYSFPKNKIFLTGNPLRKEITQKEINFSPDFRHLKNIKTPIILITGGNQGSHIINQVIQQILEDLLKIGTVVHQTGDSKFNDFESLNIKKESLENKDRYIVKKWIDAKDFGGLLKLTNLVISRAGANTLAEAVYLGVPTIVIPLPNVHNNEQVKNANYFSNLGLCEVITQKQLSRETLLSKIKEMIEKNSYFKDRAQSAKGAIIKDADHLLVQQVLVLGKKDA